MKRMMWQEYEYELEHPRCKNCAYCKGRVVSHGKRSTFVFTCIIKNKTVFPHSWRGVFCKIFKPREYFY